MNVHVQNIQSLGLSARTLEDLARESARPDNPYADACSAEIARRVAQAQIDTAYAQKRAADWMKWSVVILGIAAILAAIFQGLAWLWPNPFHLH